MNGALRHLRANLLGLIHRPWSALLLVAWSPLALILWPGEPMLPMGDAEPFAPMMALLWLMLWPLLPVRIVAGRSRGHRSAALVDRAMPALPVGPRTRALVDATTALGLILVLVTLITTCGLALLWFIGDGTPVAGRFGGPGFLLGLLAGAPIVLAVMVSWATPGGGPQVPWVRTLVPVSAVVGVQAAGGLDHTVGLVVTGLALTVVMLLAATWHPEGAWSGDPLARAGGVHHRPSMPPPKRLARDFMFQPLARNGWLILVLVLSMALLVVLDWQIGLPEVMFALWVNCGFSFLVALLALRPMGSSLAFTGLTMASGPYRSGDFVRSLGALPLGREALARGVYLHGLISGMAVWLLLLGFVVVRAWLYHGQLGLLDRDGDPLNWMLLPVVAMVPVLAGALTAGAMGDRVRGPICIGALVLFIPVFLMSNLFGRGLLDQPLPAVGLQVGIPVLFVLVAGLPPLVHLRRPVNAR